MTGKFVCITYFGLFVSLLADTLPGAAHVKPGPSDNSQAVLRADTSLVLIPLLVTTATGAPVKNLNKDNFRLMDDNAEQTLAYFGQDDAPVSIGFLVDKSGSMRPKMRKAAEAAAALFKTSNPDDEFFLVEFSDRAKLVVPFTPDSGELYEHIVRTKPFGRTSLLDAIYLSLQEMKQARNWRKALVIISDGGDNWSRHSTREVRTALLESDVQLYAMGIFDPDEDARPTREEKAGPALLEQLAEQSGGRHYPVNDLDDLSAAAAKISSDLRNEYVLGYHPTGASRDGKYHQVKVKLVIPGMASEELAQNGARRETVSDPLGGAHRTLCASSYRTYYRRGYRAPSE